MSWNFQRYGKAGEVEKQVQDDPYLPDGMKQPIGKFLKDVNPEVPVSVETTGHVDNKTVTVDLRIRSTYIL